MGYAIYEGVAHGTPLNFDTILSAATGLSSFAAGEITAYALDNQQQEMLHKEFPEK